MTIFNVISAVIAVVALCGYANAKFIRLPDSIGITAVALLISLLTIAVGVAHPASVAWADGVVAGSISRRSSFMASSACFFSPGVFTSTFPRFANPGLRSLRWRRWELPYRPSFAGSRSTMAPFYSGLPCDWSTAWSSAHLFPLPTPSQRSASFAARKSHRRSSPPLPVRRCSMMEQVSSSSLLCLLSPPVRSLPRPRKSQSSSRKRSSAESRSGSHFGYSGFLLLRSIDSYAVEILITIAMATGGYALADALGVSAPIATVVMGLMIGNRGREFAMSELTENGFSLFGTLPTIYSTCCCSA